MVLFKETAYNVSSLEAKFKNNYTLIFLSEAIQYTLFIALRQPVFQ